MSSSLFNRSNLLRSIFRVTLAAALFAAPGCARRSTPDDLAGVPLSPELRPAIEASRRSLREGDHGDPRVKADLDRYYGLWQMLSRRSTRPAAEDSLYTLWNSDIESVLWPQVAALNVTRTFPRFDAMFRRPGFPDSSTALGAYLWDWRKLRTVGPGTARAWAARTEFGRFQQVWLALNMSGLRQKQGLADEAARLGIETLPSARESGGWTLEMATWLQVARALRMADHLDDALHAADMMEALATAISRRTGNIYIVLTAKFERAEVLSARREVERAVELYSAGTDSSLAHGLTNLASYFLNRAGMLTAGTGQYEAGLKLYQRALAYAIADGDSLSIPRHLANIGRRHLLMGNLDSCRVYLQQAEACIKAYPDPRNLARFPLMQAEYFDRIGDFATVDSLHAVAASRTANLSMAELAEYHLQTIRQGIEGGRPDQAYRSITALDSLRGRLGITFADRNEIFDLDLASAEFLATQGLFERAVQALDRADSALEKRPDPRRAWELTMARGSVALRRGDLRGAEAAYTAGITMAEEQRDGDHLAESRLRLGSALLQEGRFDSVHQIPSRESNEAFGGSFRTQVSRILLGAMAESRAGRFEAALRDIEGARSLQRALPPDLMALAELESGRALAGLGRREAARQSFARARQYLPNEQRNVSSETAVFFDRDMRRELAELTLTLEMPRSAAPLRGREAERLLVDLQTLLPDWIRPRPDGDGRLIEPQIVYFVGREGSFRWTIARGETSLQRLPGEDSLISAMAPVLADMRQPGRRQVVNELSRLTTDLGGMPSGWRPDETLMIVPDGPLFAIPWPALSQNDSDRAWIDVGPIAIAETPSTAHGPLTRPPRDQLRMLALGNDGSTQALDPGGTTLHHAEQEAREVCSRWPGRLAALRVGHLADWHTNEQQLSTYDVIHIASHALVYQGDPGRTAVFLAGSVGNPLTSADIGNLKLHADLVFLSCCEAAEGVRRGIGPGHAGLARAFLAAGARTVIAPSARVDDETARQLAGRFYDNWLAGRKVEAALRSAQLAMRDAGPSRKHPYYWASYQLITSAE